MGLAGCLCDFTKTPCRVILVAVTANGARRCRPPPSHWTACPGGFRSSNTLAGPPWCTRRNLARAGRSRLDSRAVREALWGSWARGRPRMWALPWSCARGCLQEDCRIPPRGGTALRGDTVPTSLWRSFLIAWVGNAIWKTLADIWVIVKGDYKRFLLVW